ncbi:MAG: CoA ester lyase [Pseudomonadota bacterium]
MRSLLFVPADSERKLEKAAASGADALILDLEDSVAVDRKAHARALARAYLDAARDGGDGKATSDGNTASPALYVRINPLDSPHWQDDLEAVTGGGPCGIILPKARSGEDVQTLAATLAPFETAHDIGTGAISIIVIATEVPASLLRMHSYIDASKRLEGITWGAEDLSAEIGAARARDDQGAYTGPFQLARNLCLFAAHASGAGAIDTVFVNFRDQAGLRREAEDALRDGFSAKMAIHPDQVGIINDVFTPDEAQIARAQAIVDLFAANPGAGVIALDGAMLDRPHLKLAERLLARAKGPAD